jgi:hypothetical protein
MDGPFDPNLSTKTTRILQVDEITDLLTVSHAPDTIQNYFTRMNNGATFPPVSVVKFRKKYYLADGHKRYSAFLKTGQETIVVEVWTFGQLLSDQWRQFADFNRGFAAAILSLFRGSRERREAGRFVKSTLSHWRRITVSHKSRRRKRRTPSQLDG